MFRKHRRRVALKQLFQTRQMRAVQWVGATNRQTHAVNRQRVVLGNGAQVAVKTPTRHHVIFGVNLKKPQVRACFQHLCHMLGLETDARQRGQRVRGVVHGRVRLSPF